MNPDERGRFLEEPPEGAPDIDKAHEVTLRPMQYCQICQHSKYPYTWATSQKYHSLPCNPALLLGKEAVYSLT